MERVLTHPSLVRCLPKLDIRSPAKQMRLWIQQKRVHTRITDLVKALGMPSVTAAQARHLDTLGLGFQELLKLHKDISNPEEFLTNLKERGVRSKILREKLVKTLSSRPRSDILHRCTMSSSSSYDLFLFFQNRLFSEPLLPKRFHPQKQSCA